MKYVKKDKDGTVVEMEMGDEVLIEGLRSVVQLTTVVYKDNPEMAKLIGDYLVIVKDHFPLIVNHLAK